MSAESIRREIIGEPIEFMQTLIVGVRSRHEPSLYMAECVFEELKNCVRSNPDGVVKILEAMLPILTPTDGDDERPQP